jgi:GTP-binding protein
MADIPGLIEGASEGRGLGHQFLRHVERARVMCYLIDLASMDESLSPEHQLEVLQHELGNYRPELLTRPALIVGTKSDSASPEAIDAWPHMTMSAITTHNVRSAVLKLAELVSRARNEEPESTATIIMRPEPEHAWVEQLSEKEFRVHGRGVERAVALNDVSSPEALNYIDERLKKLGVPKLLSKAGVAEGDVVWIAEFSFEFVPEV